MSHKRNRSRYSRKPARKAVVPVAASISAEPAVPAVPAAPAVQPQISRSQVTGALLSALDGYSNAAAFLGEDSEVLSAGTFVRSGLTSDMELLTTAYRVSWLAKRIIDMPSEDMTRAWYAPATSLPQEMLNDLRRLEARHSVKQEITNAIRWGRLYGGSIAVMVIRGEEDCLDQPLDMDMLLPECFQGLLVLDRAQGIEPSLELVTDLDDPDFGLPMYDVPEVLQL